MPLPNAERAAAAGSADGSLEDCHAGWPDSSSDSKPSQHLQASVRVHRASGLNRKEERYRLTRPKAEALAERIRRYWDARGVQIKVWLEFADAANRTPEYVVRSTLSLSCSPLRWVRP
jgi:hypothetical protein